MRSMIRKLKVMGPLERKREDDVKKVEGRELRSEKV